MSSEDSIKDDVLKQLGDQIKAVRWLFLWLKTVLANICNKIPLFLVSKPVSLCQMPDDFTNPRESVATNWVNKIFQ